MAKDREKQKLVSDETAEATVTTGQGLAETAALSGVELLVDATAGGGGGGAGVEIKQKLEEKEKEKEVEKFITLTELTANRLSEAGTV